MMVETPEQVLEFELIHGLWTTPQEQASALLDALDAEGYEVRRVP